MHSEADALRHELVEAITSGPVIDGATGPGLSLALVRSRGLWAVATDLDPEKLRGLQPAVACDLLHLPFRNDCAGSVLLSFCLHHLNGPEERRRCIQEAARVVAMDGVVAIGDWLEAPDFHVGWEMPDPSQTEQAARGAGLRIVESVRRGKVFKIIARRATGNAAV